jgi:hypothetical protein
MQNWLSDCQDKFFVDNPLSVKENYEHVLDFALHLCRLFWVLVSLDFSIGRTVVCLRITMVHPALIASNNPG